MHQLTDYTLKDLRIMHQLYFLAIGSALYWSTNVTEISAFAKCFGMIGHVEEGKRVAFEIENVICIHQF